MSRGTRTGNEIFLAPKLLLPSVHSTLRYGNTESVINSIWMSQEKLHREGGI